MTTCNVCGDSLGQARKAAEPGRLQRADHSSLRSRVRQLGEYWKNMSGQLREFESRQGDTAAAIYGAGFYGGFVAANLSHFDRVRCFVDSSPLRQGQTMLGRPIIAPAELEDTPHVVYAGLNPLHARTAVASITEWAGRSYQYCYPPEFQGDAGRRTNNAA